MLARRDRAAVGGARKRWSAAPRDAGDWRSVSGRRSRQLLRNMEHTGTVHGFMAALATQACELGWETGQLDPPRRASRHFRHFGGMRSIHPDAFGILRPGEPRLALLPGVGAPGRAPGDDGGAAGPLPALLLVAPPHRRPRRGARRPPAGLSPGPAGAAGAAGTGLARPRRLRAGQRASGDMNPLPKTGEPHP